MEEIVFKAKRLNDGRWEYGIPIKRPSLGYLGDNTVVTVILRELGGVNADEFVIDPKTIGQYTTVNDKNNRRIFRGDIVKDNAGRHFIVEWCKECAMYALQCIEDDRYNSDFLIHCGYDLQVIGNIYDDLDNINTKESSDNQ